jgi:hypothetical protein
MGIGMVRSSANSAENIVGVALVVALYVAVRAWLVLVAILSRRSRGE